jgi:hypothetical protein
MGSYETPWTLHKDSVYRSLVAKAVTQVEGGGGSEYRISLVRVWCASGGWIRFLYRRELPSNEIGVASTIRVVIGDSDIVGEGRQTAGATELGHSSDLQFLQNLIAAPAIVITETFAPLENAPSWSRAVRFSTTGLAKALGESQNNCTGRETIDMPAVSGGR